MTHLLDSNSCIEHLRDGHATPVTARMQAAPPGCVCICSIVDAELLFGAHRSPDPIRALAGVRTFCSRYASLPFDGRAVEKFAHHRARLASAGTPIGINDLMIAAIALANGLIIVTHNTRDFSRIPGLTIEDWQVP